VKVVWRHAALTSARRFMTDQAGMRAVNQAVAALADNPEPPDAFVRGSYRRLRVGTYRVLYEVEGDMVTVVRVDKVP
jgi:mRNA-degrading endonuclease RelE of RelBE toxin-antitoxin system